MMKLRLPCRPIGNGNLSDVRLTFFHAFILWTTISTFLYSKTEGGQPCMVMLKRCRLERVFFLDSYAQFATNSSPNHFPIEVDAHYQP